MQVKYFSEYLNLVTRVSDVKKILYNLICRSLNSVVKNGTLE